MVMSKLHIEQIIEKYSGNINNNEDGKPWSGTKELVLVDKIKETDDIISFYFKAKDGSKLVEHKAGQFLPFSIKTNDSKYKGVIRTYSLSMKPNEDIYRISVKKVPNGLISNYLHDNLNIGDVIEAMMPAGIFTLENYNKDKPIVFISAGIGITPLLSMFYDSVNKIKNLTFIQAVQNSEIQPFANDIKALCDMSKNKSYIFFSVPKEEDALGTDYDFKGYVTKEWINDNLDLNSQFYFCGPPPFMKALNDALLELDVKEQDIHYEFFGKHQKL